MENMVFAFDDLGFFTKYREIIFYVFLGITALVWSIMLVRAFVAKTWEDKRPGFFRVLLRLLITCVITVLMLGGSLWFHSYKKDAYTQYEHYREAEKAGKVISIQGTVEDFASYSEHKHFTLDGVEFTIYNIDSVRQHLDSAESINPIFYLYSKKSTSSYYVNGMVNTNTIPEECLIAANQKLRIDYITENGLNRILRIFELA